MSNEWASCEIKSYSATKEKKQTSLRKKCMIKMKALVIKQLKAFQWKVEYFKIVFS